MKTVNITEKSNDSFYWVSMEDNLESFLYISVIYFTCVFVVGLFGNMLVLSVMIRVRIKSSTDLYISALSVSDIVAVIINIPFNALQDMGKWKMYGSTFGCKFHFFFYIITFMSSGLLFSVIGLDRYLKVCRPLSNHILHRRPMLISGIIFFSSTFVASVQASVAGNDEQGVCQFSLKETVESYILSVINGWLLLFISLVMCIAYIKIARRMRKTAHNHVSVSVVSQTSCTRSSQNHRTNQRNLQLLVSSKALVVMSGLFMIFTIIPAVIGGLVYATTLMKTSLWNRIGLILNRSYFVNVCINPIIYYLMNTEFRVRTKRLLVKLRCVSFFDK